MQYNYNFNVNGPNPQEFSTYVLAIDLIEPLTNTDALAIGRVVENRLQADYDSDFELSQIWTVAPVSTMVYEV